VISFRLLAGAKRFETRIFAQRVAELIDLKITAGYAVGCFE
jgi:hypothetical protein